VSYPLLKVHVSNLLTILGLSQPRNKSDYDFTKELRGSSFGRQSKNVSIGNNPDSDLLRKYYL